MEQEGLSYSKSTCAPSEQGCLKVIDYETVIKLLRVNWLKRIADENLSGFWTSYLLPCFKNIKFLQGNYQPIAPRQKHSIV